MGSFAAVTYVSFALLVFHRATAVTTCSDGGEFVFAHTVLQQDMNVLFAWYGAHMNRFLSSECLLLAVT